MKMYALIGVFAILTVIFTGLRDLSSFKISLSR